MGRSVADAAVLLLRERGVDVDVSIDWGEDATNI